MKCFCIEYSDELIYKKNFKFLGRTVSEKNAMLFSSYHRIFLENCETDEHKIFFHGVSIWVNIQKKFQVPRLHSIGEKCCPNL